MGEIILRCPICRDGVRLEEEVNLDIINTLKHKSCDMNPFNNKDSGTFQEMIDKYPFFKDFSEHLYH